MLQYFGEKIKPRVQILFIKVNCTHLEKNNHRTQLLSLTFSQAPVCFFFNPKTRLFEISAAKLLNKYKSRNKGLKLFKNFFWQNSRHWNEKRSWKYRIRNLIVQPVGLKNSQGEHPKSIPYSGLFLWFFSSMVFMKNSGGLKLLLKII